MAVPLMAAAVQEAEVEPHEAGLVDLFWPVVNFAILCGVLYYLLKTPLPTYLAQRGETIRKDLVEAARIKNAAAAQLADIDRKLHALPGEIDALRARGRAEIASEEQRIAQQAEAERDRLLVQAHRDMDLQVRLAKRALTEHAADLAVQLAGERITSGMTASDQSRLVERYLEQVER
ncbi:MAG: ATP synthase F0 subunit B [Acidobacteriota bacterium]|nr:ATP synthase F0 subunit B [Acidobacteriota bacterium]